MKIRDLQPEEVKFHFEPQFEDQWPSDHFDSETHKELIEDITSQLRQGVGPYPMWFCAKVWATWNGFEGSPEYLGCCSYESYTEFLSQDDGYYKSMCADALLHLQKEVERQFTEMKHLITLDNGMPIEEAENLYTDSNVWGSAEEQLLAGFDTPDLFSERKDT